MKELSIVWSAVYSENLFTFQGIPFGEQTAEKINLSSIILVLFTGASKVGIDSFYLDLIVWSLVGDPYEATAMMQWVEIYWKCKEILILIILLA